MTQTISHLPQHNDASYAQLFMARPELHHQLGLERSYGFLLAAACSPSLIMPDEWLTAVWLQLPENDIDTQTRSALVGLYNHWQIQKKQPYISLPNWQQKPESIAAFCEGYLAGHDWLHNLWQEGLHNYGLEGDDRIISGTLLLCLRLSSTDNNTALSNRLSAADALHLLPKRLIATAAVAQRLFDAHQQPQPALNPQRQTGRNDPCPCGSGSKFKKCCSP